MISISAQRKLAFISSVSILVGVLVALSSYYDGINADTAVAYMNGFVRWTPFFWSQDRYGMLIPALISAIVNPLTNVIVHNTLHVMMSAMCFFLLAQYFFSGRRAIEIGIISLVGYILLSGLPDVKEYLSPWQIYTPAMMFGLGALLILPRSFWLAVPIAIVASWCNFSIYVFLAILLFVRNAEEIGRKDWRPMWKSFAKQILFIGMVAASGYLIKAPYGSPDSTRYTILPLYEALQGWVKLCHDYVTIALWTSLWLPIFPVALGIFALIVAIFRHSDTLARNRLVLRSAIAAFTASLLYAFIVGGTIFAKLNGFPRRYLIPSLMVWMVAWIGLTLHLFPVPKSWQTPFRAFATLVLFATIMWRFGTPSLEHVNEALRRRFEPVYSQIPAGCTHIAGDYYRVWDSVFYSRLKGDRVLWGITSRAEVIKDLWALDKFKNPHICYWKDNADEAREFLAEYGIDDLHVVKVGSQVVELEPDGPLRAAN